MRLSGGGITCATTIANAKLSVKCRSYTGIFWRQIKTRRWRKSHAEYKEDNIQLHGVRVLTSKQSDCRKCLPMDLVKQPSPNYSSEVGRPNYYSKAIGSTPIGNTRSYFLGISGLCHLFNIKHHSLLKFSLPKMYVCINDIFQFFPFFLPFFIFFVSCFVFCFVWGFLLLVNSGIFWKKLKNVIRYF